MDSYWLKCMKNSNIVGEQIQANDEKLLAYLSKITSERNKENSKITITFHFDENEWINNEKIQKQIEIDKKGEPVESYGDKVSWKEGKNFTVKIKKNKKNKKK